MNYFPMIRIFWRYKNEQNKSNIIRKKMSRIEGKFICVYIFSFFVVFYTLWYPIPVSIFKVQLNSFRAALSNITWIRPKQKVRGVFFIKWKDNVKNWRKINLISYFFLLSFSQFTVFDSCFNYLKYRWIRLEHSQI